MIHLQIAAIDVETQISKTFHFYTEDKVFYEAGQFLTFEFLINGNTIRRSYSLSSSPYTGEELAITVKREPNGTISRWWLNEAKVGDVIYALAPAGVFTLE